MTMIDSERLRLAPPRLEDFEATVEMFSDEKVVTHIGAQPLDRAGAWTKFLRDAGHWAVEGFGLFSVFERQTGHYVGKVGHARFERLPEEDGRAAIEMSWTLKAHYHGKGYASEAAKAALDWFDSRHKRRTFCIIAPANTPSLRLADRLGYKPMEGLASAREKGIVLVRDSL